ncbi:MobA/MobL family protein (plasmid) [Chryseomicrobium palamuruense]
MSYFRLQANIISKKSQSVVASASYRSGEQLYSERDEEMKGYKSREVAPVSFILKPDNAPEWTLDRERLWNEVEKIEKAWNAQLAREVLVALPIDLSEDAQQELVRSFVQDEFVEHGMVADVSIHRDKEHNPHAHILLTVRPFNEDGSWGHKRTRQYEYDTDGQILRDDNNNKVFKTIDSTDWNERETLLRWRMAYADAINTKFQEQGIKKSVSALSFEEQGLDKIAQIRLERNEYQYVKRMEKKGIEANTFYHQLNLEIRRKNAEIEQLNHKIVDLSSRQKQINVSALLHRYRGEITAQLDEDYSKSLRFMQNRIKNNYSFSAVHGQLQSLYTWEERKIEPAEVERDVTHAVLNASHQAFKDNDSQVLSAQGFKLKEFMPHFRNRLDAFDILTNDVEKNRHTVDQLIEHAERAYRIESLIIHRAFNELYPDIDERFTYNDQLVTKKKDILKDLSHEFYGLVPAYEDMNEHLENSEIRKVCSQSREVCEQIRIQSRLLIKLGNKKNQLVKDGKDLDAIYETSIKLNTTHQLIEKYEAKARHIELQVNDLLHLTFVNSKPKLIKEVEKLPLEMKGDILHHYAKGTGRHRPSLKACLDKAQVLQEEREQKMRAYQAKVDGTFTRKLGSDKGILTHLPTGRAGAELLESLIVQAEQDQTRQRNDTPSKAIRNKKIKDKQLRRELGLEIEL